MRNSFQSHEAMVLVLFAGGGLGWGLLSLAIGLSWFFARSSGLPRVMFVLFALPYHLAAWLGMSLQLRIVDPTGLVIVTGLLLGLFLASGMLILARWREG